MGICACERGAPPVPKLLRCAPLNISPQSCYKIRRLGSRNESMDTAGASSLLQHIVSACPILTLRAAVVAPFENDPGK